MLRGKTVIVTGAAQGLGRAFAQAAAAHGAKIVIGDIDQAGADETAALIEAGGGEADVLCGSIGEWDFAQALVKRCLERFGSIDGLVNNAASFHVGPAPDETEDGLRAMVQTNVLGTMFCGTHALRAMRGQNAGGAIVNVTSTARAGRRDMSVYAATKGAVASLTYAWALEAVEYRARVNAVAPRALTSMTRQGSDSAPDHAPPESVAPVVVFLLSDAAANVTGQIVHFDGRGLALGVAPGLTEAVHHPEPWGVEQIAQSFAGPLRDQRQPVGWTGGAVDGGPAMPVPSAS
jgi:NAD(P)-dependent dehydrogenase (short-subunit alcohol dehydrogenase family)